MRVVHVSRNDRVGGAAKAMYRLHQGLQRLGCESSLFVQSRSLESPEVNEFRPSRSFRSRVMRRTRSEAIRRELRPYRNALAGGGFTSDRSIFGGEPLASLPASDIVHLHWISGFVDYRSFLPGLRCAFVVWTLHDMNPLTGGCHYSGACDRFHDECGRCPQLNSTLENDLSRSIWRRKWQALDRVRLGGLHLVAPSQWMADRARASGLTAGRPVSVIPNSVDLETYRPREKLSARIRFGINPASRVVLFASDSRDDPRKGFAQLDLALHRLASMRDWQLLLAGRGAGKPTAGIDFLDIGPIQNEHEMCSLYNAADVVVVPSTEDNFPNTILEANACGVPVVANRVGGMPELVQQGVNGRIVDCSDSQAFADAIQGVADEHATLSGRCRELVTAEFAPQIQARRHVDLYDRGTRELSASEPRG